jgi:hypothetical protein
MKIGDQFEPVKSSSPASPTEMSGRESPDTGQRSAEQPNPGHLQSNQGETDSESRARRWTSLLTGNPNLKDGSLDVAQQELLKWLERSSNGISRDLSSYPDVFQTTRFWSALKTIESPLRFLKTLHQGLQSGAFSFVEAIDHIGRNFGWEEERLLRWKQGLESVSGLGRWLPAFTNSSEYVRASFPLGRDPIDRSREQLLQWIEEPYRFIGPKARSEFEERFFEFKKNYMDAYFVLHEDALHVMSGMKKDEAKIDPVALRNLDLLSELQYTDKSYLNRVKLLARWIQHNQCHLPLNQILEQYPRCYCNFNPGTRQQHTASSAQINAMIQEGLDYFRVILRRCGQIIMLDLKNQPADDNSMKQITAVLNDDGPIVPLKVQTIKALNRIIIKHSAEFVAQIRKAYVKAAV